jgi:hypothetical protein
MQQNENQYSSRNKDKKVKSEEKLAEDRFRKKLIDEGFLVKPKDPSYKPAGDRTPIKIKGKPVSETIIEERR